MNSPSPRTSDPAVIEHRLLDLAYTTDTVGFRQYDDGWRMQQGISRPGQSIEDALKNAEPIP